MRVQIAVALLVLGGECGVARANDLLDAYKQALLQDPTFQAAKFTRDAALETRPQAIAALLPQVTVQAEIARERIHELNLFTGSTSVSGSGGPATATGGIPGVAWDSPRTYTLNVSQVLFDWSAFQTLARADKQLAQAEATYRSAEQDLVYRVADAYFTLLQAQDNLRTDTEAQGAFAQQLDLAQKKFNGGVATVMDVREAQAAFDQLTPTLLEDHTQIDAARRALGAIIGATPATVAGMPEEVPVASPNPVAEDDWVQASLRDNPDLMGAQYAADAARKAIAISQGHFLPTVNAVGTVNRQEITSPFINNVVDDEVGIQMNWALFEGGLRVSQTRQAKDQFQQALAQYDGERRKVEQGARDSYEGVVSYIGALQGRRRAIQSGQASVDADLVGVKIGSREEAQVVQAQQALAGARRSYYQDRYTLLRYMLRLKQGAGRLVQGDIEEVDRILLSATPPPPSAR